MPDSFLIRSILDSSERQKSLRRKCFRSKNKRLITLSKVRLLSLGLVRSKKKPVILTTSKGKTEILTF
jgi:hypothetical protein